MPPRIKEECGWGPPCNNLHSVIEKCGENGAFFSLLWGNVRLMVKTTACDAENRGSIPLRYPKEDKNTKRQHSLTGRTAFL